jgi:hypothetical protein
MGDRFKPELVIGMGQNMQLSPVDPKLRLSRVPA